MHPLLSTLINHLRDTLTLAIGHASPQRALIVYDLSSSLARLVTEGYRAVLPDAKGVSYDMLCRYE